MSPGFLVLTNTTAKPVTADITATSDSGATAHTAAAVPARGVVAPAIPDAVVGVVGVRDRHHLGWRRGGHPDGGTVLWAGRRRPCQSTTSAQWYFASGSTAAANTLYISLLNPTSTPVVVDLSFVTPAGMVHPINYQGIVLPAGQVAVENVTSEVQQISTISTVVSARTGRVVASEVQEIVGAGRDVRRRVARAGRDGAAVALGHPPGAGGPGRPIRNRRVQPRHDHRVGDGAGSGCPSGPLAPLTDKVLPGTTWPILDQHRRRGSPPTRPTPPPSTPREDPASWWAGP